MLRIGAAEASAWLSVDLSDRKRMRVGEWHRVPCSSMLGLWCQCNLAAGKSWDRPGMFQRSPGSRVSYDPKNQ